MRNDVGLDGCTVGGVKVAFVSTLFPLFAVGSGVLDVVVPPGFDFVLGEMALSQRLFVGGFSLSENFFTT